MLSVLAQLHWLELLILGFSLANAIAFIVLQLKLQSRHARLRRLQADHVMLNWERGGKLMSALDDVERELKDVRAALAPLNPL